MKNYYLTVVLVVLVVGFFFVFKDKKITNETINKKIDNNISVEQGLTLEITEPKDKSTVNIPTVVVKGKTSPGVDVFINEKELKSDSFGSFSIDYGLFEGENNIFVAANDSFGNYAEKTVTVYLETAE